MASDYTVKVMSVKVVKQAPYMTDRYSTAEHYEYRLHLFCQDVNANCAYNVVVGKVRQFVASAPGIAVVGFNYDESNSENWLSLPETYHATREGNSCQDDGIPHSMISKGDELTIRATLSNGRLTRVKLLSKESSNA